ncbi:hypothetical protein CEUSTIGMA_g4244.t1 [Chlamydomonas eustigma]|uniref:Uncharacterized protein n=1 Tax=Chlamydomonas eustigma TaxID=1157962 RepID=A0A250X145_9CHLO|nr:hypothetical protein CEUSTIGMA_g4244.t1 [Chlamydomonas eustigma]|eukprot:GAX76798.1 hypothetical protein CEUSTIGMA_g4244.t1 [Chlamydomonas eustigma]
MPSALIAHTPSLIGHPSRPRRPASPQVSAIAPRNAVDFFNPLYIEGAMSERAHAYLSLLAESTTTPGAIQKHLIRLIAKGASSANKAAGFIQNPLDSIEDVIADVGSELLLKQLQKNYNSSSDTTTAFRPEADYADPASDNLMRHSHAHKPGANWTKLRRAVLGVGCFKHILKTRDDSCLPSPAVNPIHGKALSLVLSVMMSSVTSTVIAQGTPAIGTSVDLHQFNLNIASEAISRPISAISESHIAESTGTNFCKSFQRAPSITIRSAASGSEGMASMGGMAASTAMKMLRADSKRGADFIDLDKIFGTVLDTVPEAVGPSSAAHQHYTTSAASFQQDILQDHRPWRQQAA